MIKIDLNIIQDKNGYPKNNIYVNIRQLKYLFGTIRLFVCIIYQKKKLLPFQKSPANNH